MNITVAICSDARRPQVERATYESQVGRPAECATILPCKQQIISYKRMSVCACVYTEAADIPRRCSVTVRQLRRTHTRPTTDYNKSNKKHHAKHTSNTHQMRVCNAFVHIMQEKVTQRAKYSRNWNNMLTTRLQSKAHNYFHASLS